MDGAMAGWHVGMDAEGRRGGGAMFRFFAGVRLVRQRGSPAQATPQFASPPVAPRPPSVHVDVCRLQFICRRVI